MSSEVVPSGRPPGPREHATWRDLAPAYAKCCAGCGRVIESGDREVWDRKDFRVFHQECLPLGKKKPRRQW